VLPPQRRIDVTCRIERSDEFVTVPLDPWGNSLERARLSLIRLNECGKGAHDLASLHRTMLIRPPSGKTVVDLDQGFKNGLCGF